MKWTSCALIAALLASCSSGGGTEDASKDGATASADLYPDLGAAPDIAQKAPCQSEWIDALFAQDKVSSGRVSTTASGGVNTSTIDASAGGTSGASKNPFVYVSLDKGTRIDITDLASRTSKAWDLAIRRTVIRVNGGDSGPGQGAVAILAGKKLADVTSVPAASSFSTDEFIDANCKVSRDPINNVRTAFGGTTGIWYDYTVSTSKVTPKDQAYVVRRANGKHVKLVIDTYYDSNNAGAHFTIRWSAL